MKKSILLLSVILGHHVSAQTWNLNGNAGTNSSTDFVGTTDNQSLVFKTNNTEKLSISENGRFIAYGISQPGAVWDKNLFFGGGVANPTGLYNTVFGMGAFTYNPGGSGNTALGLNTLGAISSGNSNTAVGTNAMRRSNSGADNVALGGNALEGAGTLNWNVAIGQAALARYSSVPGDVITANTAVGTGALAGLLNGTANVGLGRRSMQTMNNGNFNIAIGDFTADNLNSGNNNIYIGQGVKAWSSIMSNELNIGNWIIGNNGTIGIGTFTNQLPADGIAQDGEKYKLFVKDGIKTEKIKVDVAASNGWADYVFHEDYQLLPLADLETFIQKNGHLPEVPTTEEAMKNGVELKEMNILLLKKIEELTLYTIEQRKRIEALEKQMKGSK